MRLSDRQVISEIAEPSGIKALNARIPAGEPDVQTARARLFADLLTAKLIELSRQSALSERNVPVVISGMASSTVGWREVPYATTPFLLDGSAFRYERLEVAGPDTAWEIYLISGLATDRDIMRGEETELAGLMAQVPKQAPESIVILPGTHSKHVWIREGAIVDFQTYMTGELFELLATQSLLRVSVEWPVSLDSWGPDQRTPFIEGVEAARTTGFSRSLFRVRTRTVLDRVPAAANSWFLSGLLIGTEWFELMRARVDTPVVLAATGKFRDSYVCAAEYLGLLNRLTILAGGEISRAPVLAHARFLERMKSVR